MKKILILFFIAITLQAQSVIDSYSESNYNGSYNIGAGSFFGVGQSITGNGNPLDSVKFYMRKVNSPTGNCYIKLFEHTGTFGTSSIPGNELVTSTSKNVTSLPSSFAWVTFVFSTPYTLLKDSNYVIAVLFPYTDETNYIRVGHDSSSPTHNGNASWENTESYWGVASGIDLCFYAYGGGTPSSYIPIITID
jgi:hypothetical protein